MRVNVPSKRNLLHKFCHLIITANYFEVHLQIHGWIMLPLRVNVLIKTKTGRRNLFTQYNWWGGARIVWTFSAVFIDEKTTGSCICIHEGDGSRWLSSRVVVITLECAPEGHTPSNDTRDAWREKGEGVGSGMWLPVGGGRSTLFAADHEGGRSGAAVQHSRKELRETDM
jgi:hypothetical protein